MFDMHHFPLQDHDIDHDPSPHLSPARSSLRNFSVMTWLSRRTSGRQIPVCDWHRSASIGHAIDRIMHLFGIGANTAFWSFSSLWNTNDEPLGNVWKKEMLCHTPTYNGTNCCNWYVCAFGKAESPPDMFPCLSLLVGTSPRHGPRLTGFVRESSARLGDNEQTLILAPILPLQCLTLVSEDDCGIVWCVQWKNLWRINSLENATWELSP